MEQHLFVGHQHHDQHQGAQHVQGHRLGHATQAQGKEHPVGGHPGPGQGRHLPGHLGHLQRLGGAYHQKHCQQHQAGSGIGEHRGEKGPQVHLIAGVQVQVLGVADGGGHAAQVGGDGLHHHHRHHPLGLACQSQHLQGEGDKGDEGHVIGHRHAHKEGQQDEHRLQLPGGVGTCQHGPAQAEKQALPLESPHHRHEGKEHPQGVQVHIVDILGIGGDENGGNQGQDPGHTQHRLPTQPLQHSLHSQTRSFLRLTW